MNWEVQILLLVEFSHWSSAPLAKKTPFRLPFLTLRNNLKVKENAIYRRIAKNKSHSCLYQLSHDFY
jgi:hypothetical protein